MAKLSLLKRIVGRERSLVDASLATAALATATDPVTAAVETGLAAGNAKTVPASTFLAKLERRMERRAGTSATTALLDELLAEIRLYPTNERLQTLATRLVDDQQDGQRALLAWRRLGGRFPASSEALRMELRWIGRLVDPAAAQAELTRRFPSRPSTYDDVFLYARGCDELRQHDAGDTAFRDAIRLGPDKEECYLAFARSLQARGLFDAATGILELGEANVANLENLRRLKTRVALDYEQIGAIDPSTGASVQMSNAALTKVLAAIAEKRQPMSTSSRSFIGSVLMLNGSLGSGGAERQLTTTAIGLQQCIDTGKRLYGRDIIGPMTVCVRSHSARPGLDFFKPHLDRGRVATLEYADLAPFGGNRRQSLVREYVDLLRHLPPQMSEGTSRLADVIASLRPDVVHIWQDGTIFATVLAALIANVSRIVLSVRTVPPIDRPSRMKPQYEVLYPALLRLPGVTLSANSHHAARRYAQWLSIDPAMIPVVHNGLSPLSEIGSPKAIAAKAAFDARTADADFTVGAVMRFDENKRPYLWLDSAAALLATNPTARFVLLGDGPLLATATEYARMLGIADRVLFAGQSDSVGYWLKQFDAFLLLSKFEGLPNVLIEAQFAGVPVVSTAAGGAAETVLQGRTGLILEGNDTVDPRVVAGHLAMLRSNQDHRAAFRITARQWVESQFSVNHMLEQTVRVYTL